jgi:ATP-dependent protease HslVU (ClpYQ) peptidase subunit
MLSVSETEILRLVTYGDLNLLTSTAIFFELSAAARALMSVEDMTAEEVAAKAMNVAADMCVYTNKNFISLSMVDEGKIEPDEKE